MCYICSCFGWALDFVQRAITFLLTCWLGFIICLGMVIACGAGIAYGYNYCMAEWLTFGKSDVTVYMRRGQFGKNPLSGGETKPSVSNEAARPLRRMTDFEGDDNPVNATAEDYEDKPPSPAKPLGRAWSKAKDTRQYAEKLTKYAIQPETTEDAVQVEMPSTAAGYYLLTSPPKRRITAASPFPVMRTTMLKTGSSEILMRKFEPVDVEVSSAPSHLKPLEGVRENDEFFYRVSNVPQRSTTYEGDENETPEPQLNQRVADRKQAPYKYIPMRHWGVTTPESPVIPDELITETGDEESAVYKNN